MDWITAREFEDITYKKCNGVARIAFNRPNVRNAFRPKTTSELYQAFYDAQEDFNPAQAPEETGANRSLLLRLRKTFPKRYA